MNKVEKKILSNGLTVLVYPQHTIPKVAIQLWYGVGSKHEKDNERGLAHLLEHMIFKGTHILSESDINEITHKLSGSANAFTGHDYTGYIFNMPSQNWHLVLPILADCMRNCTLKEDLLSSEMKAVVQELKMYRDDYRSTLSESLVSSIFKDHPYHHPIIGYKHDLFTANHATLDRFYKQYYVPNNATLIVVGDVAINTVFDLVQQSFDAIQSDNSFEKKAFAFSQDIVAQGVALYRDVQQPLLTLAFVAPGLSGNNEYILDLASYILAEGKGSRLYRILVDEKQLATDVFAEKYDLFDAGIFFIHIDPVSKSNIDKIVHLVAQEIEDLATNNILDIELQRSVSLAQMEYASTFEDYQKIAHGIGKYYLATGNEQELIHYGKKHTDLKNELKNFFKNYCRQSVLHKGMILPLEKNEMIYWHKEQEKSDEIDHEILASRVRHSDVEPGRHVGKIQPDEIPEFHFPKAQQAILSNGLKVLWHSTSSDKIDIVVRLKAQYYDDPQDMQGLYNFMIQLMYEDTKNYTAEELALALEASGIVLNMVPGIILMSVLKKELAKGLDLLHEIVTHALFKKTTVEKIRQQLLNELASFWDSPEEFSVQLAKEQIYHQHPYAKNPLGSQEVIKKITDEDLKSFYKKVIIPQEAQLAIVGDLKDVNIVELLEKKLGDWKGSQVEKTFFPVIPPIHVKTISHSINRDQTILALAGLSVSRMDLRYDALLLLDQVITGGILNSSSSYLFYIRERTGLFYSTSGSLLLGADEQPGMIFIRSILSNHAVGKAEEIIRKTLQEATDRLTEKELQEAKNAVINSLVDYFESPQSIAETFIFLHKFKLPDDYFEKKGQLLSEITLDEVKRIGREIVDPQRLVTIKVGRIK